jgi:transcriptional regulator with XRE-family HTH domain
MTATLGTLLKRHRASAGLTQEELAERAEVSARTVSDTERGLRTAIYRDTARRLADALGLDGDSREEFEHAARGRGGPPAPPPLPVPPTRLIGREQELKIALSALENDDVRLLTLTGPGGIGKTRIALEAARRAHFAGGVFFVPLGATQDPTLVLSAIAHAVGVTWARPPLVPAIADRLRGRDLLIVLDTFEHLLDAAADVSELLASSPGVRVLVTSREVLHLRGEHEVSIPTLATSPGECRRRARAGGEAGSRARRRNRRDRCRDLSTLEWLAARDRAGRGTREASPASFFARPARQQAQRSYRRSARSTSATANDA